MSERNVLYIEDNDDNFRLIERILARLDFIVDRAETAASGIRMVQNKTYDLVLTDILLPDSTIHEAEENLLQPLRQNIGPDVPMVALTAHAFPFDKAFLLSSGCNYFMAKPINITEFQNLVIRLLQLDIPESNLY